MSGFSAIKTFDRYTDDSAPQTGAPAATGVWAMRVVKFDAGAKLGFAEDNLRTIRALSHYRLKPGKGVEPFEVYISGNVAFEYVTSPLDYDVFDGSLSPQSSTDIGANQVVVGPDAPGATITGNPVLLGGIVGGAVRPIRVSTDGTVFAYGGLNPLNGANAIITPGAAQTAAAMQTKQINPDRASYVAAFPVFLAAAGATPLFALEAGAAKTVRLRRLRLWLNTAVQTAAGPVLFALGKTTAASAGGAVVTPSIIDGNDGAFSGTMRSNNGALTTTPNGAFGLGYAVGFIPAAIANVPLVIADWVFDGMLYKPLTILPGTGNGISLSQQGAAAGAAGQIIVEAFFTEE